MAWQSDEHEGHAERLPGGWRGRCDCGWVGPSHVTATILDPSLPAAVEETIRREWAAHLPPPSLRALRQAAEVARTAQEHLEAAVRAARDDGRSWADIGAAVGISRQAAHERWGPEPSHTPSGGRTAGRGRRGEEATDHHTGDERYIDAMLVALWDGLSRTTTMRDGVLAQMDPTAREDVWHHVTEARERIATRAR